uniref:Uncharacterized protein n=1 Tax=Haptolina ericina TaxID=156174 RepID=A0A7S3BLY8_9EUKA|mmetsp:Transcript_62799/g.139829  ORF Transcript_62799/g.139829 Transcript_62799/m.139829 type:complete len:143 (+) Transcript_62799:27-455(+)
MGAAAVVSASHRGGNTSHRDAFGRSNLERVQELYLRARVREAAEVKRMQAREDEMQTARECLAALPPEEVKSAIAEGWDALRSIFVAAVGDSVWSRAVNLVPDDWEEEQALAAFADILHDPVGSKHAWLLVSPKAKLDPLGA